MRVQRIQESVTDPADVTVSTLISKNLTILGRRTSVRLEPEMWTALNAVAKRERCSIHNLCSVVFLKKKKDTSLTAAIRVFLMLYYKSATTDEGHRKAGHGDFNAMKERVTQDLDKHLSMLQF